MAASGMNNLTTLIKRLEAATSRLEDIASTAYDQPNGASPASRDVSEASVDTAATPQTITASPVPTPTPSKSISLPPAIEDFDALISGDLKTFSDASNGLDAVIVEQASAVSRAFTAQRHFLIVTTKAKRPEMGSPTYMDTISDIQQELMAVNDFREKNRASPLKDHLAMVGEGSSALGWVTVDSKPADFVAETLGGAQLYGNRVLKAYKDKDQAHVAFVQSYYKLIRSLAAYVKQHHLGGVTWNHKDGIDASEALQQIKSGPTPNGSIVPGAAGGAPPPPPPPPPLPNFDKVPPSPPQPAAKSAPGGDMGAVFDQLNRGESVTAGLRKVDKSEMTHKNPSLRTSAPVPTRSVSGDSTGRDKSPTPAKKPKPESMRTKKPPRKELDGNKWIIENFDDHPQPLEIKAEINHSILISRCTKTTIRVIGKANAISVDNSSRFNLVIDSLVSSVDVIKCPNFALQVLGTLPTVLMDQVDGASLYLSKESLGTEVFTSKCSSVNVVLPPGAGASQEDDGKECPLPEQIRSVIINGQVISEIVEHAG
ncbi:hypothetical protein B0A49_05945 [Cryomyces minteri]|uniref:Adenylyl cyclase-associated protein n=1 Tax=Cryomyces minteri TaxID=331657 RepID=A0A4U0X1T4_9PEZI|nr:hypothetical protein B0A49_05945 [Cryomyces minteri]